MILRKAKAAPMLENPKNEMPDPKRKILLRDTEAPNGAKSSTEIEKDEPNRANPYMEIADPQEHPLIQSDAPR